MQILKGHTSEDTAYLVEDYPYGFKLRCKIRYWLEYKSGHGFRFCTQTTNPRITVREHWNTPRKSRYSKIGACMYLDEKNYVKWTCLSEYTDSEQAAAWFEQWGEGVPTDGLSMTKKYIAAQLAYDKAKHVPDCEPGSAGANDNERVKEAL
jgi:hypothetical protein